MFFLRLKYLFGAMKSWEISINQHVFMSTFVNSNNIKPRNTGIKKIFGNLVLEELTRINAVAPIAMYYVIPVFLIGYDALYTSLSSLKFFGGVFFLYFFRIYATPLCISHKYRYTSPIQGKNSI